MFNSNMKKMLTDSYINNKTKYGTSFLPQILGGQMIHMSYQFQMETEDILDRINNHSAKSREAAQNRCCVILNKKHSIKHLMIM